MWFVPQTALLFRSFVFPFKREGGCLWLVTVPNALVKWFCSSPKFPFMSSSFVASRYTLHGSTFTCLVAMTFTVVLAALSWGHSFLWNGTAWPQYLHHKWLRICLISRIPQIWQHEVWKQTSKSLQYPNITMHYKQLSAQHNATVDHHWTTSVHIIWSSRLGFTAEAAVSNLLFMVLLVARWEQRLLLLLLLLLLPFVLQQQLSVQWY